MAQLRKSVLRGITEVGEVAAGPTDVPWGKTLKNGAEVAHGAANLMTESGQDLYPVDSSPTGRTTQLTLRLLYSDLLVYLAAFGLPTGALTGDLQAGTPTAEVLSVLQSQMGTVERKLYLLTPGPKGPRRRVYERCKVRGEFREVLDRENNMAIEMTFDVLAPASAATPVFTITDNP
jgi:hypothetical protein